jgi:hypothetical protein
LSAYLWTEISNSQFAKPDKWPDTVLRFRRALPVRLLNETSRTMVQAKVEKAIAEACHLLASTDAATVSEKHKN